MARVIVILTLMIAITATMFAITRKPAVAPGEAANGPSTTVPLGDVPRADPIAAKDAVEGDDEEHSLISADPRPVANEVPVSTTASAQDVTNGPVSGAAPSFGTAGIDHTGNASFTGTATPGDTVSLVRDGTPLGTTKADNAGNWEIAFKAPTAKTEQELFVSAQGKDGSVVIGPQRATIRPPATAGGLARITLKAADQTSKSAQEDGVAAPEVKTGIVVEKITGGEAGITTLIGKADPGATVKAAINGKPAGETRVAADGAWTLAATNPSGKRASSLRLELVDAQGARLDETVVPYKVPAATAKVASREPSVKADFPSVLTSDPSKVKKGKAETEDLAALFQPATTADAEHPKRKIIRVRRGDSLWRISRRHLGNGRKWAAFYKANKAKIDNPDMIFPGQTLIIPG